MSNETPSRDAVLEAVTRLLAPVPRTEPDEMPRWVIDDRPDSTPESMY